MIIAPLFILFSTSLIMISLSIVIIFIIIKQFVENQKNSLNHIIFFLIILNIILSRGYIIYNFIKETPQNIFSDTFSPAKKRGTGIFWYVFPGLWYIYVSNFVFINKLKILLLSIIYYSVILGYIIFEFHQFDYDFGKSHLFSPISFMFYYTLIFVFLIIINKFKTIKHHTLSYKLWLSYCLLSFSIVLTQIFIISKFETDYSFFREWLIFANLIWVLGLLILILFPRIISGDILTENRILNKRKTSLEFIYSKIHFWSIKKPKIYSKNLKNRFQILENIQKIENKIISGNLSLDLLNSQVEFSNICGVNYNTFNSFFNEYGNYSWSKYQKGIKIVYSIYLIKNGFLKDHTLDQLAVEVHFKNRITLYNNFKFFLNSYPSEFVDNNI